MNRPPTADELERIVAKAREDFADLLPTDAGPSLTVEQARNVTIVAGILIRAPRAVLCGALAASFVQAFGKAAPVIARRLVEVHGDGDA